MLEGSRNEAYLDGIANPKNPAKFYSLDGSTQDKLPAECIERTGKKPITTVGIDTNIENDEVLKRLDQLLGQLGLMREVYLGR